MQSKRILQIVIHVLGWSLFFSLPFLLRPDSGIHVGGGRDLPPPDIGERVNPLYFSLLTNALMVPFFYLNLYVIIPRFIAKHKYALFVFVQVILLFVASILKQFIFGIAFPGGNHGRMHHGPVDFFVVFTYLFITLIALSYCLIQERQKTERIQKERENETLRSELQFLRWQVSPHFLFNVLNNIVALARIKSDKVEDTLIKLSVLMRYMLYESDERKISLEKEVTYLQSYIGIQSLRLAQKQTLHFNIDIEENTTCMIEPMLLIPFIENAFKHGTAFADGPFIDMDLSVKNNELDFKIKNRTGNTGDKTDDTSGIGLTNVERRLELLYPGKYLLEIKEDDWFSVKLKIVLA